VSDPAPAAIYQSEHNGNFTYTIPGLVPGGDYLVRLHFAGIFHNASGLRVFHVRINGTTLLNNLDIYAEAGAKNKALIREFTVPARCQWTDHDPVYCRCEQCQVQRHWNLPAACRSANHCAACGSDRFPRWVGILQRTAER
jgi:hypothetical protein